MPEDNSPVGASAAIQGSATAQPDAAGANPSPSNATPIAPASGETAGFEAEGIAANNYRRSMLSSAIGLGLSAAMAMAMHVATTNVKGHANVMVMIPLLGYWLCLASTLVFALLFVANVVSWLSAGRPKPPF